MTNQELLHSMKESLVEAELAYRNEPCEERLQEVLQLQARVTELERLVHSVQ